MLRLLSLLIFLALIASVVVSTVWYFRTPQPMGIPAQINYASQTAIYEYAAFKQPNGTDPVAYFQPLADQGNVAAQTHMAELYFVIGQTDPEAYSHADAYLIKAADQGVPNAQNALGVAYRNGLGVNVDKAEAYKWFTLSAKQGADLAEKNLADVTAEMSPEEVKQGNARVDLWLKNLKKY